VHELRTPFEPFAFAGEAQVAVALAGGATRDFNLMVRRSQARGELRVCRAAGALAMAPSVVLVFCARGQIDTDAGVLRPGDAWRPATPGTGNVSLRPDSVALVVHIQPCEG
jgi:environmental stress-induced protein Ves